MMATLRRAIEWVAKPIARACENPGKSLIVLWLTLGVLLWVFLLSPYLGELGNCLFGSPEESRIDCLNVRIAKPLRGDSVIAAYAAATVGVLIAYQFVRRGEMPPARSDEDATRISCQG